MVKTMVSSPIPFLPSVAPAGYPQRADPAARSPRPPRWPCRGRRQSPPRPPRNPRRGWNDVAWPGEDYKVPKKSG